MAAAFGPVLPSALVAQAKESILAGRLEDAAHQLEIAIHANAYYLPALHLYQHLVTYQPDFLKESYIQQAEILKLMTEASSSELKELITGEGLEFANGTGLPEIPLLDEGLRHPEILREAGRFDEALQRGDMLAKRAFIEALSFAPEETVWVQFEAAYGEKKYTLAAACLQVLIDHPIKGQRLKLLLIQQHLLEKDPKTAFIFSDERPVSLPKALQLIRTAIVSSHRSERTQLKAELKKDAKNPLNHALLLVLDCAPEDLSRKVASLREAGDVLNLSRLATLRVPEAAYQLGELLDAAGEAMLAEAFFTQAYKGGSEAALASLTQQREMRSMALLVAMKEAKVGAWREALSHFQKILHTSMVETCPWLLLQGILQVSFKENPALAAEEGWDLERVSRHLSKSIQKHPDQSVKDQDSFIKEYLSRPEDEAWRLFFLIQFSFAVTRMTSETFGLMAELRTLSENKNDNVFLSKWVTQFQGIKTAVVEDSLLIRLRALRDQDAAELPLTAGLISPYSLCREAIHLFEEPEKAAKKLILALGLEQPPYFPALVLYESLVQLHFSLLADYPYWGLNTLHQAIQGRVDWAWREGKELELFQGFEKTPFMQMMRLRCVDRLSLQRADAKRLKYTLWKELSPPENPMFLYHLAEHCRATGQKRQALLLYEQAQSFPPAQYQLAECYEASREYAMAKKFYEAAAGQKLPDALFKLGQCHEQGRLGYPIDPMKALRFYHEAAALGHQPAAVNCMQIEKSQTAGATARQRRLQVLHARKVAEAAAKRENTIRTHLDLSQKSASSESALFHCVEALMRGSEEAKMRLARIYRPDEEAILPQEQKQYESAVGASTSSKKTKKRRPFKKTEAKADLSQTHPAAALPHVSVKPEKPPRKAATSEGPSLARGPSSACGKAPALPRTREVTLEFENERLKAEALALQTQIDALRKRGENRSAALQKRTEELAAAREAVVAAEAKLAPFALELARSHARQSTLEAELRCQRAKVATLFERYGVPTGPSLVVYSQSENEITGTGL